jgi:hypothetical protein
MTTSDTRKAAARKPIDQKPTLLKLNDAQRNVLSRAAQREDGAAARPENLTERATQKLGAALVEKGLAREIRAKADMPLWRRSDEGRTYALIITKLGKATIQTEGVPTPSVADHEGNRAPSPAATVKGNVVPVTTTVAEAPLPSQSERVAPREGTKLANVIALLGRECGAGIDDLTTATGWLRHTTRAALTGLRKRGFVIERTRSEERGSLYRILNPERISTAA